MGEQKLSFDLNSQKLYLEIHQVPLVFKLSPFFDAAKWPRALYLDSIKLVCRKAVFQGTSFLFKERLFIVRKCIEGKSKVKENNTVSTYLML